MPNAFTYQINPARIVFGPGTLARVAEEITGQGCRRALILSTPFQKPDADQLSQQLGRLSVGVFPEAAMHTPVEVTERALAAYAGTGADCVVAIGGGSTIGLGKAIALRTDLPQMWSPTTYAGSEMTPILGRPRAAEDDRRDPDPARSGDLRSGADARPAGGDVRDQRAQRDGACRRGPLRERPQPDAVLMAAEGSGRLKRRCRRIVAEPRRPAAREPMRFTAPGSAARCLGTVGMAMHHKLCHMLGGSFDLPHAETHAVVLPQRPPTTRPRRRMPCSRQPIFSAARSAVASTTSRPSWGPPRAEGSRLQEADLDRAVDLAVRKSLWNPRPIEREAVRALLQRAWAGTRPE